MSLKHAGGVAREELEMLIVVEWSQEAFAHPPSLRALAEYAAEHEVVVVCSWRAAGNGAVFALRRALPRHDLVAVLVDEEMAAHERRLVEELLNDGAVPVILTTGDPAPSATAWLPADALLSLPAAGVAAGSAQVAPLRLLR